MRVSARVRANRANASRSTGPKSNAGRERSARNAYKHGLSIPSGMLPECSPIVEAYVAQIIGPDAPAPVRAAAVIFAEAQVDVDRVRRARLALYEDVEARKKKDPAKEKVKASVRFLTLCERIDATPEEVRTSPEIREVFPLLKDFCDQMRRDPEIPTLEAGIGVLARRLAKLWRYERRALSRRNKAAAQLQLLRSFPENGKG